LATVWNNFGYDYHVSCEQCVSTIKQEIHDMAEQEYYDQMMEDEYRDRLAVAKAKV